MIDFRYHLVSLVSVFLALALGIILGAGPLQNSIGNALQSQVTNLRVSRDQMRVELDQMEKERQGLDAALVRAGEQLIPHALEGRRIGLIILPDVDSAAVEDVRSRIGQAGGSVAAQVQLEDGFTSADNASYRKALAAQMAEHIEGVDAGSDPTTVLSKALSMIVRTPSDDPTVQTLTGYFTAKDKGHNLATINLSSEKGVDAVLVVVPSGVVEEPEGKKVSGSEKKKLQAQKDAQKASNAMWRTFYITVTKEGPTVALGEAVEESILLDFRSANTGSTVDSFGSVAGSFNTVFALASAITGTDVHLGSGEGATAPFGTRVDAGNHG